MHQDVLVAGAGGAGGKAESFYFFINERQSFYWLTKLRDLVD